MSKLIVISGPSGAGKGTIVQELLKIYRIYNDKVYLSVSVTTREPREGEVEGINYYFITLEEFEQKIKENEFLEYNKYGTGKYYGTLKSKVLNYLKNGYDVILEIDINGYKQVMANYTDAIGIFIAPPSLEELEKRLRGRATESEENIQKRLKVAKIEMENQDIYPHVIINEEGLVTKAALEVYKIIKNS